MTKNEHGEAVIKWITITVLIAVSLFFVVLYKNVFLDDKPKGQTEQQPPSNSNPPDDDEKNDPPVVIPEIKYSTFPRVASTSNNGEYYINTGGTSDEILKDVIDIGGFFYLILETDSNGYDYRAERESIAIAKMSNDGTIISTLTLMANRNEYYLCSKITNYGMLIAASGKGGITYYGITFDLTYSKAITSDEFTHMEMFYTREGIIVAGTLSNLLTIIMIDDNLNNVFYKTIDLESNISIMEIFPSTYGFSIVTNIDSETPCSYFININNNGDFLSKNLISSNKLLKIMPISSGFALLEKSGTGLYLKAIDNSYIQQFRTQIGEGIGGDFYPLPNGYVTFIYNDDKTISKHLCRFGDIITINDMDFMDIIEIKSFYITQDSMYFYADIMSHGGTKDTKVINYTRNNMVTYSKIIGGYFQDNAVKIIIKDNLLITFMTTHSNNSNFMDNFGGSDIFVFASSIS